MMPVADDQDRQLAQVRFQRIWLMAYVALFSSLLAFFVVLISMVQLEGVVEKRAHQQLTQQLYMDIKTHIRQAGIDWLAVENAFPKGVRLYPKPVLFRDVPLFVTGRATITPRAQPYLRAVGQILRQMGLGAFEQRYAHYIQQIESRGYQVRLTLRVEGHTDATPLAPGAPFPDNTTLSVFRAYAVMRVLKQVSLLPDQFWGIAGYGHWQPLYPDPKDPRNRRVELYIQPQMLMETRDEASG
jgi:chemotaxis protein MotB